MATTATGEWTAVEKLGIQCPICEKTDYCRVHADGLHVHCERVESRKPWGGPNAGGWVHSIKDKVDVPPMSKKPSKPPAPINWECLAYDYYNSAAGAEVRRRLTEELNVNERSLRRLRVGGYFSFSDRILVSTWPERDEFGEVVGIIRRFPDGKKLSMRGGAHGLFWPSGIAVGSTVFLPEGGSDVAALLSAGFEAVGRPSCNGGWTAIQAWIDRNPQCHRVIVVGENDRRPCKNAKCNGCTRCCPGWLFAKGLSDKLSCEYILPECQYKDIREWLTKDRDVAIKFLFSLV